MKDAIQAYIERVRDLSEHCRGNEQATRQSLIGPLLTLLGYDLTDPRECRPEYKADFGKERSVKPVDWAFLRDNRPIFFVEAKEVGRKLNGFDEQLADYFAKSPDAKLGILTNGQQWRFFTDLVNLNVMDTEPFVRWDVLGDEEPPYDLLTLLQRQQYNPELIRTFALRRRNTNLLVSELNRLLEPSTEFTRLAVLNLESRNLTTAVVDSWKPMVSGALVEWVKQRMLTSVLEDGHQPRADMAVEAAPRSLETTPEELEAFGVVERLLGVDRRVGYQDNSSYFKIHLPERHTWVVCRLYLGRRRNQLLVPLELEVVEPLSNGRPVTVPEVGWCSIPIQGPGDLAELGGLLCTAWDHRRRERPAPAA